MEWTQKELEELYQAAIKKSMIDKEFRKELMEDSKKAMEKLAGRELPEGFKLKFIEKDPNYWGTIPMAVATFLEAYDFTGKTILPLCTNEGSGMGSSESDVKKYANGASLKKGLSITGSQAADSKATVEKWLKNSGIM